MASFIKMSQAGSGWVKTLDELKKDFL